MTIKISFYFQIVKIYLVNFLLYDTTIVILVWRVSSYMRYPPSLRTEQDFMSLTDWKTISNTRRNHPRI